MNFDTGSSNLLVLSVYCSSAACNNHDKFNSGTSSTYRHNSHPLQIQNSQQGGGMTFGGVDPNHYTGPISWIPLSNELYWITDHSGQIVMSAEKGKSTTDTTSYSDWMSQLPAKCQSKHLYHLAIPGSHDSMSYDLDINSSIIEPDSLKKCSKICCARKIVRKWATTQEEPITKQLDAGVRYFDLRVARKPHDTNPTRLYFYHGLLTRTDVETVLTDINDWAKAHPKEILILALSHFRGFDDTNKSHLHDHLIKFIKNLFGDKLFPSGEIPTLKSCWDKGKNVIVSYDYQANRHPQLWSKITYYYGNSMNPTEVETKLRQQLAHAKRRNFFVCGLNLTLPENAGILRYILRLYGDLRSVIRRSLPRMVHWLKEEALKTHVNIVASDLVTSDDFVSTVVELNYKYE